MIYARLLFYLALQSVKPPIIFLFCNEVRILILTLFWSRIKQVAQVVTLRPFDCSSSQGRSSERHRRLILTAASSGTSRAIGLLTSLIAVPISLRYLGPDRYGLWMTLISLITLMAFGDLGLGNGLLNGISEAYGKGDQLLAQRYVSCSWFILLGLGGLLAFAFALSYPFIPWDRIFNSSASHSVGEAGPAMAVLIGCFSISICLTVVTSIQTGYQEGFANSLWNTCGNLLGFGGLLLALDAHARLPWLVLSVAGGPVLGLMLNGGILFYRKKTWLRPRVRLVDAHTSKRLFKMGMLFFALQFASSLAFASDNIVVSHLYGFAAVTEYSVVFKLFSVGTMLLTFILSPLWPAYGEAIARNDIAWVRRTLKRSILFAALFTSGCAIVLLLFGQRIIHLWVGPHLTPSFSLLSGMAAWLIISGVGISVAMLLNGANVVKFQVICAVLMATAAISGKIFLPAVLGLSGIIWATVAAYLLFTCIPTALYVPRMLAQLEPT